MSPNRLKKSQQNFKKTGTFFSDNLLQFTTTFSPQKHHKLPSKTPRFHTRIRKNPL